MNILRTIEIHIIMNNKIGLFQRFKQRIKTIAHKSLCYINDLPARIYHSSINFLIKRRMRRLVLFLSHGGVHLLMACIMIILCIFLWKGTIVQMSSSYKKIVVNIVNNSSCKLNSLRIDIGLNSDNLKKAWGVDQAMSIGGHFEIVQLDTIIDNKGNITYRDSHGVMFYPEECPYQGLNKKTEMKASLIVSTPNSKFFFVRETFDKNNTSILFSSILLHLDSIADNYVKCDSYYSINEQGSVIWGTIKGNIFSDENNRDPYYRIFLDLNIPICESLNGDEIGISYPGIKNEGALNILNVFPPPNIVKPDFIGWRGKEKIQEISSNSGILLFFEDLNRKAKTDREVFLCTVLLGTALAFLLDIIVNLIIKWRNLVSKM